MKKSFRLEGLDCANCAAKIEKEVKALDGVTDVTVNAMTAKMVLEADDGTKLLRPPKKSSRSMNLMLS